MGPTVLPAPVKKVHKALLPLFVSLVVVCYLDRTSLAFAALQLCNSEWFNAKVYGLGSGMFYFSYVLFQIPSNLLLNRLGAKTWLPVITAAWGLVAACCVFISGPGSFYALRLALGAAEAGAFPGMWFVCGQFYPHAYITTPYSVIEASIAVSQIIAAPVAAALLQLSGFLNLAGWQWLFLTEGLATLVLAGVLRWRLPRNVMTASFLTEDDKIWLLDQIQAGSHDGDEGLCNKGSVKGLGCGKGNKAHQSGGLAAADAAGSSDGLQHLQTEGTESDAGPLLHGSSSSSSNLWQQHQQHRYRRTGSDCNLHHDNSNDSCSSSSIHMASTAVHKQHQQQQQRASHPGRQHQLSTTSAVDSNKDVTHYAATGSSSSSTSLTAWQQVVATFSNKLILYLMLLKALKDIALDGLVYWVPMLVHALIDGSSVALSSSSSSSSSSEDGDFKHCGGKQSQLAAVLLSAIPFGTAAVAAVAVGHSSEVRQERKLHIGLPLVAGGVAFLLLPLLLGVESHVPAFLAVTVAVVAADATTGPFWSWVHMAAKPGTGAVSLAAVNSVGKAGGFLGPLSFGLILHATGSYIPSILLVGGIMLAAGGLALMYFGEKWSNMRYEKLMVEGHELAKLEADER